MEYKSLFICLFLLVHQTYGYFYDGRYEPPTRRGFDGDGYNFNNNNYDEDRLYFPDSSENDYNPPWRITTTSKPTYSMERCISSCQVASISSPVCGTNDVTYENINNLWCAARCGVDVRPKSWTACPRSDVNNDQTQTRNNLQACMNVCPTTSEYNPVCGTDNVTYNNIGKLYCAKECGVAVELKRQLPCPKTTTPLPPEAPSDSYGIQECKARCPVTSEYNPVCGTNDVTYKNIGSLECARECGVDVSIRGRTACHLLTPPTTSEMPLIDKLTTKKPSFTIPQDILDSIFIRPEDEDLESKIDRRNNRET